jgi:hypothetical protein
MSTFGKVLLVFLFLASLGLLYVGARTMKTLDGFRSRHNEYVAAVAERDGIINTVTGTAFEQNPSGSVPKGILQISRELEIQLTNQGRLWMDCPLAGRDNANPPTLTIQVGNPAGVSDKGVLYVFEQQPPQQPQAAAYEDGIHSNNRALVFLGEFKVSAVNGNNVSLQATRRLIGSQVQALRNSQGPFACYEQLPVDLHSVWQEIKKTRADKLPRFFDGAAMDAAALAALVKDFQRDGEPADADADKDERILVEVKFLKDYADLPQADKDELTALGFKIVNLRTPAGDDVKDAEGKVVSVDIGTVIQKDTIAYFMRGLPDGKPGAAKVLVDKGIAQEERRIYLRQLRDYGLIFRQVVAEMPVLENRIKDLDANNVAKGEEKAKLDEDIAFQEALQKLLMEEQQKLNAELAAVQAYKKEVTADRDDVLTKIVKLEKENQKLAAKLKEAQLAEAERITREARERVSKQGE